MIGWHGAGRRHPTAPITSVGGDVFDSEYRIHDIARVFAHMASHPECVFKVPTAHPGRAHSLLSRNLFWVYVDALTASPAPIVDESGARVLPNVLLGVVADTQRRVDTRVASLLATPAAARFLDVHPVAGPVTVPPTACRRASDDAGGMGGGLDWVIAAGRNVVPDAADIDWVRALRDQVVAAGIAFSFYGWADGVDRHIDGHLWDDIPRVRAMAVAS